MTALVTKHLPLVAGAPDGIKKLRELILDLAVSGKLVPQAQEPTAIEKHSPQNDASEAAALRSSADADYTPFPTPSEWGWKKLGDIAVIERGGSPRPIKSFLTTASDGLNWIKIGDTEKGGKYITSASEKIRPEGLAKTRMVYPGDFLLTNSMSFGRPYITQIEGCIHDGWLRISPPDSLDRDYLYALLSSPYVRRFFVNAAAGAVVMNLNADKVRELPVPLPPLAEQHRIVAKVDELMALCDRLEADQADAEAAHAQLVQALLDSLTRATNAADFRASWQRLSEHFHTLFTTEASMDALKQAIRELAIRGALTCGFRAIDDQHTGSENMSVSFPIPRDWNWVTLDNLVLDLRYGTSTKCSYEYAGTPVLRIPNVGEKLVTLDDLKFGELSEDERQSYILQEGDILMIRSNGSASLVGRTAIVGADAAKCAFAGYLVRIRLPRDRVTPEYFHLALGTSHVRRSIEAPIRTTSGVKNINSTEIRSLQIPLPPLPIQHRIVAKVDELVALCDQLKAQLTEASQQHAQLATVLVEHAVA